MNRVEELEARLDSIHQQQLEVLGLLATGFHDPVFLALRDALGAAEKEFQELLLAAQNEARLERLAKGEA